MNRQAITQGMDGTSETPDHRPSCSRHPQEKENAMNVCMRSCWTAAAAVVLLSMIQPAVIRAADTEAQMPWEKVGANVGVFLAGLDSSIRIGSGTGVYIMPIDFGIRVSGLVDDEGEEKFTASLPVFYRLGRPF
jgi:hypothetical protein